MKSPERYRPLRQVSALTDVDFSESQQFCERSLANRGAMPRSGAHIPVNDQGNERYSIWGVARSAIRRMALSVCSIQDRACNKEHAATPQFHAPRWSRLEAQRTGGMGIDQPCNRPMWPHQPDSIYERSCPMKRRQNSESNKLKN